MWSIGFHHDINLFNHHLFPTNILGQIIVTASSTWTSSWSHHTTNYRSQADLTRIHPICSATKDLAILVPPWRCPIKTIWVLKTSVLIIFNFQFIYSTLRSLLWFLLRIVLTCVCPAYHQTQVTPHWVLRDFMVYSESLWCPPLSHTRHHHAYYSSPRLVHWAIRSWCLAISTRSTQACAASTFRLDFFCVNSTLILMPVIYLSWLKQLEFL